MDPLHPAGQPHRAARDERPAALDAGGIDNDAPGRRGPEAMNYYAAFVLDPDGNNVEAGVRE